MGRRKGPLPPLAAEIVQAAFAVTPEGVLIRRSTGANAVYRGPNDQLLARVYLGGSRRRIIASRLAWAIETGEWPRGVVRHRDDDERNFAPSNLLVTRRGPRPFVQSEGGKGSSLARRAEADAALINALAEHQGALTVPQLSVSVGQSAPCCCVRLARLAAAGLTCGPMCNARQRWNLTPAGQALVARAEDASIPVILDDTDRRILGALALSPVRLMTLARLLGICRLTARRRLDRLMAQKLVEVDEDRFQINAKGRDCLGPDAPLPWFNVIAISAAAAKDVRERSPTDNRSAAMHSANGRKARRASGYSPFSHRAESLLTG
jgi:hypothetical protein